MNFGKDMHLSEYAILMNTRACLALSRALPDIEQCELLKCHLNVALKLLEEEYFLAPYLQPADKNKSLMVLIEDCRAIIYNFEQNVEEEV